MKRLEFSEKEAIQFMYPDEPVWSTLSDQVLIELVEDYEAEQSCATSALCELRVRHHPKTRALAEWLLRQAAADKHLKAYAREQLA